MDDSGKSLFAKMLYDKLVDENIITQLVSEPYSIKQSKAPEIFQKEFESISNIRELIVNLIKNTRGIRNETKDILFRLDRTILYKYMSMIEKSHSVSNIEEESILFISDRSFISNIVYQSTFTKDTVYELMKINIEMIQQFNISTNIVFYMRRDNDNRLEQETNTMSENIKTNYYQLNKKYERLLGDEYIKVFSSGKCEGDDIQPFNNSKIYTINNNNRDKEEILNEIYRIVKKEILLI